MTISGSNFTEGATVKFGPHAATGVSVSSPTSMTAISPAGTGTVDVVVSNAGGASPAGPPDQFTYVAPGKGPTVTKVEPAGGPTAGGTAVTVTGKDFSGVTAVTFGALAAAGYTVSSPTSILAVAPAEPAGTVDNTVTTPNGTSPTSKKDQFAFSTADSQLSAIDPAAPAPDFAG